MENNTMPRLTLNFADFREIAELLEMYQHHYLEEEIANSTDPQSHHTTVMKSTLERVTTILTKINEIPMG